MAASFIDDTGKMWPADLDTLTRLFGELGTGADVATTVISLGFIFLRVGIGVQVALRPELAAKWAITRFYDVLRGLDRRRIALARDANASAWELLVGVDRAIARIEQLIEEARSPSPRPMLTDRPMPIERCRDIASGLLLPVLEAWQQRRGRWEPELMGCLQESGLLATTAISRQPRGSNRLVIEHWGSSITSHGADWVRIARGRDFEDQPNTQLGQWDATKQRGTLAGGVPKFSEQDYVFRRLTGELVRVSFHRLALPWESADGAALITAVTAKRRLVVLDRPNPRN